MIPCLSRMLTGSMVFCALSIASCQKAATGNFPEEPGYTEEFDTASAALQRGWAFANASIEKGTGDWANPSIPPPFDPFSTFSTNSGYLWTDFRSTSGASGIISNWVLSPVRTLQNGDRIEFYTRAQILGYQNDSTDFVNRLQVRLSSSGESRDVGLGQAVGHFTTLLLDINPTYREFLYSQFLAGNPESRQAYPHRWTRFEVTVSGLAAPVSGRYAFRYFVEGAGSNSRSSGIGIDKVSFYPVPH
jgi:hypothetical protein